MHESRLTDHGSIACWLIPTYQSYGRAVRTVSGWVTGRFLRRACPRCPSSHCRSRNDITSLKRIFILSFFGIFLFAGSCIYIYLFNPCWPSALYRVCNRLRPEYLYSRSRHKRPIAWQLDPRRCPSLALVPPRGSHRPAGFAFEAQLTLCHDTFRPPPAFAESTIRASSPPPLFLCRPSPTNQRQPRLSLVPCSRDHGPAVSLRPLPLPLPPPIRPQWRPPRHPARRHQNFTTLSVAYT